MDYPAYATSLAPPLERNQVAEAAHEAAGSESIADTVLAARVVAKDANWARALEQLFLKHAPALLRYSARFLRNDVEAEDLVHDVFVQAAQRMHTYRGEGPFRTWLFSLAINLTRSRQRRWKIEDRATRALAGTTSRLDRGPAWNLEQRELREKIDAAIAALSEAERETFLLYWFGELSYTEISGITGVSVPAAKVRVHRALARLGKMLEELR